MEAIVFIGAVCLNLALASGSCVDLDVTGCRTNPQLCQDPLIAEVTCPVMCNRCPNVPQTTQADTTADCSDLLKRGRSWSSGVYTIVTWKTHTTVDVFCDMDTDGGGWTVFKHRVNGSVDFYQNFSSYENGFGSPHGEFWLGLRLLNELTSRRNHTLRIDLKAHNGTRMYDVYDGFSVGAGSNYTLHVDHRVDSLHLPYGHLLSPYHDGQPFSTYDHDMDQHSSSSCAITYHGGWWYNGCYAANLNGRYFVNGFPYYTGMVYMPFATFESVKKSKMMFK
ncbi:microfibril-associated glycoprotein 4-like [Mya arenaria]|uniref:microfibril-associated glycoprotein 4-like n=1 Tax=Mya arenaria TaxID=6604 RepID=UPI0022E5FE1A|nr:microfibril-associated glycoprotein 4-like [Mya arenaria]